MKIRITKSRLKTFLSYDAPKMLAAVVLVCFLLVFIFSWVAVKPSVGQQFYTLIDRGIIYSNKATSFAQELLDKDAREGGFSYDIVSVNVNKIVEEGTQEASLNNTYTVLGEDDIVVLTKTLFDEYAQRDHATELTSFPSEAVKFLTDNSLIVDGEVSKSGVDAYFIKTRSKDKRFKTESQIEKGKQDEFNRVQAIYDNAVALDAVFKAYPNLLVYKEYEYYGDSRKGYFAIDFSYLNGNGNNHPEDLFRIATENEGEYTTNGIYIAVGTNFDKNGDLYYETLAFLRALISSYSTYMI